MGALILSLVSNFFLISSVFGHSEFCNKRNYEPVLWVNRSNCPFGILFPSPVLVDCFVTSDEPEDKILADVCKGTTLPDAAKESAAAHPGSGSMVQIQYIPETTGGYPPDNNRTCNLDAACMNSGVFAPKGWEKKVQHGPLPKEIEPQWPEYDPPSAGDPTVLNQTEALFRHLLDMVDADNGPNSLRIVTLLKKSFEIVGKFCDPAFVPLEFNEDIERAFYFILAESVNHKIVDVGIEEFRRIDEALNHCLDQKRPFKFVGGGCKRYSTISTINHTKTGSIITYERNEFSWSPEKYDIPVDVTWSAMDFVHGLCYGTFRQHVNSHHLYQQAIERLFLPEIIYRWDKPIRLARQHVWDHFFSANVRASIRNLEHCVQAAYYDAPFLHRLERMLLHFNPSGAESAGATPEGGPAPEESQRKRRDTAVGPIIVTPGIYPIAKMSKLDFHCFKTEGERDYMLDIYKANVCSEAGPEADAPAEGGAK